MENQEKITEKSYTQVYEIGYLLVPSIPEEKVGEESASVRTLIEEKGGVLIAEEMPKMKPLAYSISRFLNSKRERFNQAYFGWIKFELSNEDISSVKSGLDKNSHIIRSLCIGTVRESTLARLKPTMFKKTTDSPKKKKEISEEELEKSIEKLVGETSSQ